MHTRNIIALSALLASSLAHTMDDVSSPIPSPTQEIRSLEGEDGSASYSSASSSNNSLNSPPLSLMRSRRMDQDPTDYEYTQRQALRFTEESKKLKRAVANKERKRLALECCPFLCGCSSLVITALMKKYYS